MGGTGYTKGMQMDSQRERYLSGELTHDQYYGLLVEALGENRLRELLPATPDELAAAWEEGWALNSIPLAKWDARHAQVRPRPISRELQTKLEAITGPGGWSLSDSVCTLKCCARRLIGKADQGGAR